MLTPDERRGARLVLALILIGAIWDWRGGQKSDLPAAATAFAVGDSTRSGAAAAGVAAPDAGMPSGVPPAPAPAPASPTVDLNHAGSAELDALPGIGPVLARRILEHRALHGPFHSVAELRAVRGVGPALMSRLAGRVRVANSH